MTSKTDAQCRAAIKEFCEITGKDETVALEVLQEVDFDLEEGVVRYYSVLDSGPLPETIINEVIYGIDGASNKRKHDDNEDFEDLCPKHAKTNNLADAPSSSTKDEILDGAMIERPQTVPIKPIHEIKQARINEMFPPVPSTSKKSAVPDVPLFDDNGFPTQVVCMSYNIDGLDGRSISNRTVAVLHVMARANPEIMFFQEVIAEQEAKFRSVLSPIYNIFTSDTGQMPYYTLTAVSKNIKVTKSEIINYDRSQMGRNMLLVEAKWKNLDLKLINTHLESCWDQGDVRKRQFFNAMDKMKEFASDPNVFMIFGGDLNLRDTEVSNLPEGVVDAWVAAGSNNDTKYTWDTKLNDNKEVRRVCRNRFDRFFVRSPYQKMDFRLEGKERIKGSLFPSDHFAIVCKFTQPKLA
ncbi:5'-tyrosyl-DNA phosphodiesterase [Aphelenchoides bicaudatus]|nr:5'-tyrosyl-DNA phosphodiesterase [Aphelenchoides bicaudatus]